MIINGIIRTDAGASSGSNPRGASHKARSISQRDAAAKISSPVGSGRYRLDVASDAGTDAPTSVSFYVGWSGDASADTPDLLDVTIDKTNYKPGEDLKLDIASRFAGKATVAILSDKISNIAHRRS